MQAVEENELCVGQDERLCAAITSVFVWEWRAKKKCNDKVWFHLGAVYVESEELPAHTYSPLTAASYRVKIKKKR